MEDPDSHSLLNRARKQSMSNPNLQEKSAVQVQEMPTVHIKKELVFSVKTEPTTHVEEKFAIKVEKDSKNQVEKALRSSLTIKHDGHPKTSAPSPEELDTQIDRLKGPFCDLNHSAHIGTTQREALIADHDAKTQQSARWCDQAMRDIRAEHLAYVEKLDNELQRILKQLDNESKTHQTNKLELDMIRADLNTATKGPGSHMYHPLYFPPKASKDPRESKQAKQYKEPETPAPAPAPVPVPVQTANANDPTRFLVSFRLPPPKILRSLSEEPPVPSPQPVTTATANLMPTLSITPILTSINTEPACGLKRKHDESDSPHHNKKPRSVTTPAALSPSGIEKETLRPKLIENAFCFISAWHVEMKEENLVLMRQMLERFSFYPEAIRADATGYFLIFESTERGDRLAEACWGKFKTWKFRMQHMYMKLFPRGTAMTGYD